MSYASPHHVTLRLHHVTLRFPHVIPRAVAESTGLCDCAQGDTCVIGVQASHDFPYDSTMPPRASIPVILRIHYATLRLHCVILREDAGSIDEAA